MKKNLIVLLILLFVWVGFVQGENKDGKEKNHSSYQDAVIKTYQLNYISPATVHKTLRQYFWESSYDFNGDLITVKIGRENIAEFEKHLKQLDVEKKNILIRIFSVIASTEGKSRPIPNKELQEVLEEVKKILNFKSFQLDGMSAITVKQKQDNCMLKLSSHSNLTMFIQKIYLKGKNKGERIVGFKFEVRQKKHYDPANPTKYQNETLIESEASVNENGYLVAGVSKMNNGDSLVLVINAEIK